MQKKWWHGKVFYQIYPKSFKDSNGDGIGDIRGIIEKLDYIKALGVDLIWISPIYVSPFVDQGYDIADYQNIDPIFGSMQDFDELLEKAKALNLGIIMDLVINHCSSEHKWFKKALADPKSPERNYFYFRKGKEGHEPDNLRSYFGGSVWEKVRGEDDLYYLHYFAKEQPDLNWYNEDLRHKLFEMINWWLDKGIAGFRVDAIMNIVKDLNFPGLPKDSGSDGRCAVNQMTARLASKVGPFLQEMNEKTFKKHDAFSIGEAFSVNPQDLEKFIGDEGFFSSIFDFSTRELNESFPFCYQYRPISVKDFRESSFKAQLRANDIGFLAPIIENHDEPRGVSYFLPAMWQNSQGAKALGTVNLLLRGIPFIYQGQELGMTNTQFNSIYEFEDLNAQDQYKACLKQGLTPTQALAILNRESRDHARTPMLWDESTFAGFSNTTPWLKVHQDKEILCVKAQESDPNSTLNYYRKLTALKHDPAYQELLTYGLFKPLENPSDFTICFERVLDNKKIQVFTNFDTHSFEFTVNNKAQVLLSSGKGCLAEGKLKLNEGSVAVLYFED